MNIKKFKKKIHKKPYVVVISYYDDCGNVEENRYIAFQDYEEATNFICWGYNLDKSVIIEENITNPEKYYNDKRTKDDYTFKINPEHNYAFIYDNYYDMYVEAFSIEQLDLPCNYASKGYDKNIDYNFEKES